MATAIPRSKSALRIFPIPKYRRITNNVAAKEIIRPLRDPSKIMEKVKKRQKKTSKKNRGNERAKSGLTK
ncbi:MAG: hypothetical protein AAB656_04325 [Patescibacteria group bacterium]